MIAGSMPPILAAAAVAAGAALQSAAGFGFSLTAAPLLFAAAGPEHAVGLLIVLGTLVNVLTLATERRRPRPLGGEAARLVAWAAPGALAGVAVLRALDAVALQLAVSAGVLATLAARHVAAGRRPRWALPLAGLAAGGLTTSTTTAGPPLLVYLLGRGLAPERVRDTLTVTFLGLGAIGAAALVATRTRAAAPDAAWLAVLVPLVLAGHLAGRPIFARLAGEDRYEPVLTVVLLAAVAGGLASALAEG